MRLCGALLALISTVLCAQDALNQGVAAFKSGNYPQAAGLFQEAVAADPNGVNPHLYLATAYMSMWTPGASEANARAAETEFRRVLELDANNTVAIASLASLAYNRAGVMTGDERNRKFDDALDWYKRLAAIEPGNKVAPYSMGVIAWAKWYPALMTARAKLQMKPEDPGPLPGPVREELKAGYSSILAEGIANLEAALRIDPDYADAMAYLNLLIRERADLRDTKEQYLAEVALADDWMHKSLAAKKAEAPSGSGGGGGGSRTPIRDGAQTIQPMVKADPVYPERAKQARIQGTVRFTVTIGTDGSILNIQLISGHPLLVAAAKDAVEKYVYNPVMLDGSPVEAITRVDVNFSLGQ